jgi:hypothetical protein
MDRLLDSFKDDEYRVYSIKYFLIFLLSVFIIAIFIGIFLLFRNGTISITKIIDYVNSLPTLTTNYILYGFAIIVFIIIISILLRSQSSNGLIFSDNKPIKSKSEIFWKSSTLTNNKDPKNLRINAEQWQAQNCDGLSVGVEMIIINTRSSSPQGNPPYRHVLHRGTSDLFNYLGNAPGSAPIGAGGINDGLPSEMAPGILIDKQTNDLIIFMDTEPDNNEYNWVNKHAYRESIRINDLPLNKAFHLHLIINSKVLEVYVNCKLAGTKVLRGKPRNVPNEWFGRTGFATSSTIIQNLTLWDEPLNTFDLMNVCKNPITINKELVDLVSNCI